VALPRRRSRRGGVFGHGGEGWGHGNVRRDVARRVEHAGDLGEAWSHGYDDGGGGRRHGLDGEVAVRGELGLELAFWNAGITRKTRDKAAGTMA